ncbi:MAG: GNAT family N-acetyltransferase [Clostridia bacterium]|nr:GNAT family N-acetyltransferase [Clostridia bacterium]
MDTGIRPLREEEYSVLADFLLESVFVPEGSPRPPASLLEKPELQVYLQNFGSEPHDWALAAEHDGHIIGIVWARIMNDYGHVDDETPSLAMALLPGFRHRGTGTALLVGMLRLLGEKGYRQVSLSVQKANTAALGLYRKIGFYPVSENKEEYIMVRDLPMAPVTNQ